MTAPRHVAVIDIGKTNAKVAVVDLEELAEVGVVTRPNRVLPGPPYPHFDIDGLKDFVLGALRELQGQSRIDAISVTTHGASAALIDAEGQLAAPVMDYEFDGPEALAAAYDRLRPPFSETGSPRLPVGLNLGAQLHWQLETQSGLRGRVHRVVTYPQFWSGMLTGQYRNEVTSLGCHTDLWNTAAGEFSSLVAKLGLEDRMAPQARAAEVLGPLLPGIASATGLPPQTPVLCGIHDSNASLYPHLLRHAPPFSVVSTGTWVIAMAIGGRQVPLDPARDTLINVNALGDPVPSARFMGGREYDMVRAGRTPGHGPDDIAEVLDREILLLPPVQPGSGPYPKGRAEWSVPERGLTEGQRAVALSFYLSLMSAVCLGMIGAQGPVLVEGPFAGNRLYLEMLATATGRPVSAAGRSATGTSIGAAMLAIGGGVSVGDDGGELIHPRPEWAAYAKAWRAAAERRPASGI